MQKFLFSLSLIIAPVLLTTAAASAQAVYRTIQSQALVSDKADILHDAALFKALQLVPQKQAEQPHRSISSPRQHRLQSNLITGGSEAFPM